MPECKCVICKINPIHPNSKRFCAKCREDWFDSPEHNNNNLPHEVALESYLKRKEQEYKELEKKWGEAIHEYTQGLIGRKE